MPTTQFARKGISKAADMTPELLAELESGRLEAATLTEELCINFAALARNCLPDLPPDFFRQVEAIVPLGIVKRIQAMGELLVRHPAAPPLSFFAGHRSNLVRSWGCFVIAAREDTSLAERLQDMRPFAADTHYGVREWAWLAVRPHLAAQLDEAISLLTPWATSPDEGLRRFACEALRPRGVWCAHLEPMKQEPERGLPILTPLCADPSRYVQNSVANWLNDAAKSKPEWVTALCDQWLAGNPGSATRYICKRGLRTVVKKKG